MALYRGSPILLACASSMDRGIRCMEDCCVSRLMVVSRDIISYSLLASALYSAKAESLPPLQLNMAFFFTLLIFFWGGKGMTFGVNLFNMVAESMPALLLSAVCLYLPKV